MRSAGLLLATCCIGLPIQALAHGSPVQWSAESTDYGCWITRWLGRTPAGGGEMAVGLQVVLGRIIPARDELAQPAITKAELDGKTTLNVRVVDPSIANVESVSILRSNHNPTALKKRQLDGELGDFPSFYLTGATAESILASLRSGQVSAIVATQSDGSEVRFANTDAGLRVGFPMYDACIANKPKK